jgi:hypothetical protein
MMGDKIFDELPHDGGTYEKLKDGRYRQIDPPTQAAILEPTAAAVEASADTATPFKAESK